MQRTTEHQREHDALVEKVVAYFARQERFGQVQAQLDGHRWPGKIKWKGAAVGQVPDIQAWADRRGVVVEVETGESIFDDHTEDQWKLFSKFARAKRWTFWIVVPQGQEDQARLRAMMLGLKKYKVYGVKSGLEGEQEAANEQDKPA